MENNKLNTMKKVIEKLGDRGHTKEPVAQFVYNNIEDLGSSLEKIESTGLFPEIVNNIIGYYLMDGNDFMRNWNKIKYNMDKNKKLSMEEFRKIVSENAFKILEDLNDDKTSDNTNDLDATPDYNINQDDIDADMPPEDKSINNPLETNSNNDGLPFSQLSNAINNLVYTIKDNKKIEKLDSLILKAISTGRIDKNTTFEKMVVPGVDKAEFEYFLTVLATLYKTKGTSASEKENIRKAIFLSLPIYNTTSIENTESGDIRSSSLANLIARKSGIGSFLGIGKTIDASYYLDIIADSIYDAIDYALENYSPIKGGAFFPLFLFKAISNTKDKLGSKLHKKTFSSSGEKQSLDEPIGSENDNEKGDTMADRITGKEGEVSIGEKEAVKEFAGALKTFVQEKLGQKESLKNYLEFFNLFTQGHSLSEIADIMEKNPGNLRVIKKRMEDFITKFVESGELQDYISEETGLKVDFPNNRFSLSVQGSGKGEGEVEPVEYFQVSGHDPQTGEPTGEWIKITPETHDSETTWFNNYGDLVFGNEEANAESNFETAGNEEENQITESDDMIDLNKYDAAFIKSLMKTIQKRHKEIKK